MKLRQLIAATVMAVAGINSSFAAGTTINVGNPADGYAINGSQNLTGATGSFTDIFNFSVGTSGSWKISLLNPDANANFGAFTGSFDGASSASWTASGITSSLAAGAHTFTVTGSTNAPAYGSWVTYSAQFNQVAAVPEPETVAMLLAGLGLIGMVTRRRNRAQVV